MSGGSRWWRRSHDGFRVEFTFTVPKRYDLDLKTSGGSIELENAKGDVYAHPSGGSISVGDVDGEVDVETSGGSLEAEFLEQFSSSCELSTSGGTIKVYLGRDIKADIDARTSGGEVQSDLPITVRGKFGDGKLRGKINGGGPMLTLRTSSGNIILRER